MIPQYPIGSKAPNALAAQISGFATVPVFPERAGPFRGNIPAALPQFPMHRRAAFFLFLSHPCVSHLSLFNYRFINKNQSRTSCNLVRHRIFLDTLGVPSDIPRRLLAKFRDEESRMRHNGFLGFQQLLKWFR
jgi:hypothetical protein